MTSRWRNPLLIPLYALLIGVHVLGNLASDLTDRWMTVLDEYHDRTRGEVETDSCSDE